MARIHAEVGMLVNGPALFIEFRKRPRLAARGRSPETVQDSSPRLFQLDFERHYQRAGASDPVAIFRLVRKVPPPRAITWRFVALEST